MNPVMEKIMSRGYWHVIIRPAEFQETRIPELGACKKYVRDLKVDLRGWDYPHYDMNVEPTPRLDYVEQFTDWKYLIEGWRFYQSAQFVHRKALWEDWVEGEPNWGRRSTPPGESLSITGTVYLMTEIYEFASRLAANGYLGEVCEIQIGLYNTENRKLTDFGEGRLSLREYRTALGEIPRTSDAIPTSVLIGKAAEFALEHVVWLFERFGWDNINPGTFKEDQSKLLEKRL